MATKVDGIGPRAVREDSKHCRKYEEQLLSRDMSRTESPDLPGHRPCVLELIVHGKQMKVSRCIGAPHTRSARKKYTIVENAGCVGLSHIGDPDKRCSAYLWSNSVCLSVCVSEFVSFVSLAYDTVSVPLGVPHVSVPDVRVYVLVCPCMSVHVKIIYICRIYVTT